MKKNQRIHREWFRSIIKRTCVCGKKQTQVFSWGEYVAGRWNTVEHVCEECFPTQVLPRLVLHAAGCGCNFEIVGYRGEKLPAWLALPINTDNKETTCGLF